jgi:hypothetical protein
VCEGGRRRGGIRCLCDHGGAREMRRVGTPGKGLWLSPEQHASCGRSTRVNETLLSRGRRCSQGCGSAWLNGSATMI